MHILLLSSASQNLILTKPLLQLGHRLTIIYDQEHRPLGDKSPDRRMQIITEQIVNYLQKHQKSDPIDALIVSPMVELGLDDQTRKILDDYQVRLVPLFEQYLTTVCLPHSLVGKLGLVGSYADISVGQQVITTLSKTYSLSPAQQATKTFQQPRAFRSHELQATSYYLETQSRSDPHVNKLIKNSLRYFKDANVDTVIPLCYGLLNYDKTIGHCFNPRTTRRHGLTKISSLLESLIGKESSDTHPVRVMIIGSDHRLRRQHHRQRLWSRGKQLEIEIITYY